MQRVLTGIILSAFFIAAVFLLPSRAFLAVVAILLGIAALELVRLLRFWAPDAPLAALFVLAPLVAGSLIAAPMAPDPIRSGALLIGATLLGVGLPALVLILRTPVEQTIPALGALSFGAVYLGVPAYCLWRLQDTDPWLVILLLLVAALNDTAAFYVGSAVGRHKMAPKVSPNKTWEGAAAGLAAGIAATALWSWWRLGEVSMALVALGAVATAASQIGDLVESMLKRAAGVKDSGNLLPGHGGILDRADGLFFAAPVVLLAAWWTGLADLGP